MYFTWQDGDDGDDGAGIKADSVAADDSLFFGDDDGGLVAISDEEPDSKEGCDLMDSLEAVAGSPQQATCLEGEDCMSEDAIEDVKDTEDANVLGESMEDAIEPATQDAIQDGMEDVELEAERALDMERAIDKRFDLHPSDKHQIEPVTDKDGLVSKDLGGGGRATKPSNQKRDKNQENLNNINMLQDKLDALRRCQSRMPLEL